LFRGLSGVIYMIAVYCS